MTQDTRKDKRAKIVSLNVRYKSATVDEFIENHSHDVSKGGLFIKTPTPFPPGTLIKFEIRIAGDKSVIAGVGRVVWKREAGQAAGERPAGMGVKFIKIDDASRTLIDRVVLEKSDAGREYDENPEGAIVIGAEVAAAAEAHDRDKGAGPQHKATMMGLGSVGGTPAARLAPGAQPARATGGGGMFPATNSIGDMPEKKERTVMKQAAELLEEALKEAGGSMDDVGSNPLFAAAQPVGASAIVEPPREAPKSTLIGMPAARDVVSDRLEAAPRATGTLSAMSSEAMKREAGAAAAVAKSVPHDPVREAPYVEAGIGGLGGIAGGGGFAARGPSTDDEGQPTSRQRKTDPPARRSRPASAVVAIEEEPRPAKKGGSAIVWVGLIVAAGAGAAYFYKDTLLGAPAPPPASAAAVTAPAATLPPTIPPPPASATSIPATDTTAAGAATAAPAAVDAGLVRDAGMSAVSPPAPVTAAPPPATAAPPVTARPTPKPRPVATPPAEGATAAPPPKPKPAPKPASTDDDNPY
jgi:uncharacterized protein (TIGR02266 family)